MGSVLSSCVRCANDKIDRAQAEANGAIDGIQEEANLTIDQIQDNIANIVES